MIKPIVKFKFKKKISSNFLFGGFNFQSIQKKITRWGWRKCGTGFKKKFYFILIAPSSLHLNKQKHAESQSLTKNCKNAFSVVFQMNRWRKAFKYLLKLAFRITMTISANLKIKYQPNIKGGTCSPPATPHRQQRRNTFIIQSGHRGLQNCQRGLDLSFILFFWCCEDLSLNTFSD